MPRVLVLLLVLAACGGNNVTPPPEVGPVASVTLTPGEIALELLGETTQLVARARDADGTVVPDAVFTWESSDPSVATVDGDGLVTAVSGGQTTVTVTANGFSDTSTIRVTGPSDLTFLLGEWGGEALSHSEGGTESLALSATGAPVVAGAASRLSLLVGTEEETRQLVLLARIQGTIAVYMALADGARGTFTVAQGFFDGLGGASFDSRERLGEDRVERVRMGDFRETSFDILVDASEDGGDTWTPVWTFHLQRTPGSAGPPAMTSPACSADDYAAFDFWAGDWNVTAGGGPSGTNRIEPVATSCALQENWTNTAGGTGISLNMFDPRWGGWTQFWVDSSGGILELRGGIADGAMVLEGPQIGNASVEDRVTWTPNEDGTVRQLWETNTSGAGWVVTFDGLYHPTG